MVAPWLHNGCRERPSVRFRIDGMLQAPVTGQELLHSRVDNGSGRICRMDMDAGVLMSGFAISGDAGVARAFVELAALGEPVPEKSRTTAGWPAKSFILRRSSTMTRWPGSSRRSWPGTPNGPGSGPNRVPWRRQVCPGAERGIRSRVRSALPGAGRGPGCRRGIPNSASDSVGREASSSIADGKVG